jgi:nucleoid-associated protein YgaU
MEITMKKSNLILLLIVFGLLFSSKAFSQPDEQLTKEQATARILEYQTKVADLEAKLKEADGEYISYQKKLEETKKALIDCNESVYKLVGATPADVDKFRQKLGVIEGKLRTMQRLSDDVLADKQDEVKALEAELNLLRGEKIAVLPEFFNKIQSLAKEINPGLLREKKIKSYTVGTWADNKDCLWNISGKMDIYGDPFQWPKIWQANTNLVRNPDIIHPGQVLTLPQKGPQTNDEQKALRKYWRNKKAAEEKAAGTEKPKEEAPKK